MWNNVSRAFRTHVYNPRPSAGVLVEDDPDSSERSDRSGQSSCSHSEHVDNKDSNSSSYVTSKRFTPGRDGVLGNSQEDPSSNGSQKSYYTEVEDTNGWWKTSFHSFWHQLHGSRSMFEAITWGPVFVWGSDRENFKRKNRLLYRMLFALPGCDTFGAAKPVLPTIREEQSGHLAQPKQLAIKDAAGAAMDQQINISKTETLELAMEEFQKVCREYTACSESLQGLQAVKGGDMPTAVAHLRRSCIMGNLSACFNLGLCYETGTGVPQDDTKAVYYYQKAAKGGHKMALYNLGLMCLKQTEEESVAVDRESKAKGQSLHLSRGMGLDFLQEAARLGLPEAQVYLGLYHMQECQEPARAVSYFKAAAQQNDSEAQYLLAMCYEQGLGVETNECLAARLYSLAAQAGHDLALYNLGVFNEEGLGGLPQNETAAVEMYQKAVQLGNSQARERLTQLRVLAAGEASTPSTQPPEDQNVSDLKQNENGSHFDIVFGLPEGEEVTDLEANQVCGNSNFDECPILSVLSPSASFPSLRSLSSLSLPKPNMRTLFSSSSHHPERKFMMHNSRSDSLEAVNRRESFLGKVNFFLGLGPSALTMEHGPHFHFDTHSEGFSPHTLSLNYLCGSDERSLAAIPSMHRSQSFSEFSMIGI